MSSKTKYGLLFNQHQVDLADAFLDWVAKTSTNKLESVDLEVIGVDENNLKKLKKFFDDNEFYIKRKQLARDLSLNGNRVGLGVFFLGDLPLLKTIKIHSITYYANTITEVYVSGGYNENINDTSFPVYFRYSKTKDGIIYQEGAFVNKAWSVISTNTKIPNLKEIPIVEFKNNAYSEPDIPMQLRKLLQELDFYGDSIGYEWEKVKKGFLNIEAQSSKSDNDVIKQQQKGGYVTTVKGNAANLQESLLEKPTDPTSLTASLQMLNTIEDMILKYANLQRDTLSTGSNKHTYEVAQLNQNAWEALEEKRLLREKYYSKMVRIICDILSIPSDGVSAKSILSEIEQYKIDSLKADLEVKQSQVNVNNSQAKANNTQEQVKLTKEEPNE